MTTATAPARTAPARTVPRADALGLPPDALLRWLVPATAATAVAELLVLRVFTRTIIHIPGAQDATAVLGLVADAGRFAYYLAAVLLVITLVLLVGDLVRRGSARSMTAAATVLMFIATSTVARAGLVSDLLLATVTGACVVTLTCLVTTTVHGYGRRVLPICFVAGYACSAAYTALSPTQLRVDRVTGSPTLLFLAEALVLAGATLSPLLVHARRDRLAALVGLTAGLGVLGMLVANASTTKILLLWNIGLSGYFPDVVYAVAFGALVYTVIALARSGNHLRSLAILLVLAGGIGLHSTYQTGLVVAGLGVLALLGDRTGSLTTPWLAPRQSGR